MPSSSGVARFRAEVPMAVEYEEPFAFGVVKSCYELLGVSKCSVRKLVSTGRW